MGLRITTWNGKRVLMTTIQLLTSGSERDSVSLCLEFIPRYCFHLATPRYKDAANRDQESIWLPTMARQEDFPGKLSSLIS
jgi:hypothetical protein